MSVRALITGITGMVGSHLCDFLLENTDWEIYGVCRWRSPLDNVSHLLSRVNDKDRVYFEYADLNDEVSLITVLEKVMPHYIFHLAAQSYPLTSFTSPIDTLNTNILGTCRLLEAVHIVMKNQQMGGGISRLFMYVHPVKYLEKYRQKRNQKQVFTRNVHFIQHPLMPFPRLGRICLGGIMLRLTE